jgi:hypothetical protein
MAIDRVHVLGRVMRAICGGERDEARKVLRAEYPFVKVDAGSRRYTELTMLRVFMRDGFLDRYTGERLVFPGVFRVLSRVMPEEAAGLISNIRAQI